jgi:hypothetical protein
LECVALRQHMPCSTGLGARARQRNGDFWLSARMRTQGIRVAAGVETGHRRLPLTCGPHRRMPCAPQHAAADQSSSPRRILWVSAAAMSASTASRPRRPGPSLPLPLPPGPSLPLASEPASESGSLPAARAPLLAPAEAGCVRRGASRHRQCELRARGLNPAPMQHTQAYRQMISLCRRPAQHCRHCLRPATPPLDCA